MKGSSLTSVKVAFLLGLIAFFVANAMGYRFEILGHPLVRWPLSAFLTASIIVHFVRRRRERLSS